MFSLMFQKGWKKAAQKWTSSQVDCEMLFQTNQKVCYYQTDLYSQNVAFDNPGITNSKVFFSFWL